LMAKKKRGAGRCFRNQKTGRVEGRQKGGTVRASGRGGGRLYDKIRRFQKRKGTSRRCMNVQSTATRGGREKNPWSTRKRGTCARKRRSRGRSGLGLSHNGGPEGRGKFGKTQEKNTPELSTKGKKKKKKKKKKKECFKRGGGKNRGDAGPGQKNRRKVKKGKGKRFQKETPAVQKNDTSETARRDAAKKKQQPGPEKAGRGRREKEQKRAAPARGGGSLDGEIPKKKRGEGQAVRKSDRLRKKRSKEAYGRKKGEKTPNMLRANRRLKEGTKKKREFKKKLKG